METAGLPRGDAAGPDAGGVICLGGACIERIFRVDEIPDRPIKVQATAYRERCGGIAATAALAVAGYGRRASLRSRVGADADGARIADRLARAGVDISAMRRCAGGKTAGTAVIVDRAGGRLAAPFSGAGLDAADDPLAPPDVAHAGAVLADMRWPQDTQVLLRAARCGGVPGILVADTGATAAIAPLAALAGHIVFTAAALRRMGGIADLHGVLRQIARDAAAACVAAIEDGTIAWIADGKLRRIATRVPVVEAGAGALGGAYALAIAQGKDPERALRFAAEAAMPDDPDRD